MAKTSKRALALILTLILICFIPLSASAESAEIILTPIYPKLHNSAGPTVDKLENYVDIDEFRSYLINGLASCPKNLDVSKFKIPYTNETFSAIGSYIYYETPELFHIAGIGGSISGGYVKTISPSYRYTAQQYGAMLTEFYNGANKLLKGIKGNTKLSDVEKALLLHDRLALWCEYDYERLVNGTIPEDSYTAYGVFSKKTAVCMGYALAYDYLLLQVGIDSAYCSSDVLNHAWNIVYVNNSKYHVDVTWDDPVWDKSGQVYHDNFLRSTQGIKENHDATDYDTSPTDTTFDTYYWQSSESAFQLVNGDIYYIDSQAAMLKKISNGVTTNCISVSGTWRYNGSSYWPGNYSRLDFDGKNLLFTLPNAVYKYDVENGTSSKVFTPSVPSGSYYSIFGFKYEDCKLVCELINTPNYDENTKKNNTTTQAYHVESDWITTKAPTPDSSGKKSKVCINCNTELEALTIPAINLVAKEKSVIDYGHSVIFTDIFTCKSISQLVTANGNCTIAADNTSALGSGTVATVFVDGEAVHTLTLIVNGDINGDSVCDVLDIAEAERFVTNKKTPELTEIYAANSGIAEAIDESTYQSLVNKALSI